MNTENKELNITFKEFSYQCGDGCCDWYGTITTINGVELPLHNQDYQIIVEQILEYLGYKVNITTLYNGEEI